MIKLTTPETDALDCELNNPRVLQDRYSEMLEHARKLERERDEWYYKAHANVAFTLEARAERDEAREKAERYRLEANALMLQRDEAREEINRYREKLDLLPISWDV